MRAWIVMLCLTLGPMACAKPKSKEPAPTETAGAETAGADHKGEELICRRERGSTSKKKVCYYESDRRRQRDETGRQLRNNTGVNALPPENVAGGSM